MKRVIIIFLVAALMLSMAACSGSGTPSNTPSGSDSASTTAQDETSTTTEATPEIKELALGETAATDIVELTLDKADLAIALGNTVDDTFFLPREYSAESDNKNPFVAAKGHTLVAMTYTANNLDRASVDLAGYIAVEYKEKSYPSKIIHGFVSENGSEWKEYNSSNVLLSAGEKSTFRCYVDIPVEADSLEDDFKVQFSLPSSDGKSNGFVYDVTAADRLAIEKGQLAAAEEKEIERLAQVKVLQEDMAPYLVDKQWHSSAEPGVYIVFYADGKAELFDAEGTMSPMHWEPVTETTMIVSPDDKKQGEFHFDLQRDDSGAILSLNVYSNSDGGLIVSFAP